MEAGQETLQLLPRQKKGVVAKQWGNSKQKSFFSNIYEIKLKENSMDIFQYCFDISPQLPPDSDGLIEKISKQITLDLKKNIGHFISRGFMVWGRKEMNSVLSLRAEFTREGQKYSYEVLVKPTKKLSITDYLLQNSQNIASVAQILNINTKQVLRDEKMVELTPGSYYSSESINQNKVEGRLNVWRGLNITVTVYNRSLYLQVDPCSRVLRDESFLQTLEADRQKIGIEAMNIKYKDHSVLRKYGSPKIYKIAEIDPKQSPKCKFLNQKEGVEMTYIEYYKKVYGVTIKNERQPLLKVLADRKMNKNKKEGEKIYIYLVPELVCLTGLNDQQRSNFKVMRNLAEFTKMKADTRMYEANKAIKMLQKEQNLIYTIKEQPKPLNGFKMETPRIKLGPNKYANLMNGEIKIRQRILDPYDFREMIFCYSVGKYQDDDRADADEALSLLQKASKTFDIQFKEPIWVQVQRGENLNSWFAALSDQKKKLKSKPDIVFVFVTPKEEKFYGDLKKFITLELDCPCQFSTRKKLSSSQKGSMSVASKIAMQMNAKMGHSLWTIQNTHPALVAQAKQIAVAGITSSKGKAGTFLSFVGGTNAEMSGFFSDCKQVQSRQNLSAALFQGFFTPWIQTWFKTNSKKLPGILVIYREGLNQTQAKFQFDIEVTAIKQTVKKVREKTQITNYDPVIVYMLVNKRPNSRIFEGSGQGKNRIYDNPEPGSIIFQDLSQGFKEFHLASVSVREGTCTPVSFKVGYENRPDFPLEAISELTYNLSYCYFNWTGSVRVPAPLQYANKYAKLFSEIGEMKTSDKASDMKKTLFFL